MTWRCLIIDDEDLARELIKRHLREIEEFELVASCASAFEARKILQTEKIDLLFLDIEMPVLKGTDFFKNLIHQPKVIFTTAYREYAIDGFDLNAVDYLLKPITFVRFFKAIEKFLSQQTTIQTETLPSTTPPPSKENFIFIRKDRKQVKLILDSILYIESLKDYIKIHLANKTHTVKYSITAFHALLAQNFIRVHRSYIVNADRVSAFSKQGVEIEDINIPIGASAVFQKYLILLMASFFTSLHHRKPLVATAMIDFVSSICKKINSSLISDTSETQH